MNLRWISKVFFANIPAAFFKSISCHKIILFPPFCLKHDYALTTRFNYKVEAAAACRTQWDRSGRQTLASLTEGQDENAAWVSLSLSLSFPIRVLLSAEENHGTQHTQPVSNYTNTLCPVLSSLKTIGAPPKQLPWSAYSFSLSLRLLLLLLFMCYVCRVEWAQPTCLLISSNHCHP